MKIMKFPIIAALGMMFIECSFAGVPPVSLGTASLSTTQSLPFGVAGAGVLAAVSLVIGIQQIQRRKK